MPNHPLTRIGTRPDAQAQKEKARRISPAGQASSLVLGRFETGAVQNWAVSVDPAIAVVEALPPLIAFDTPSK